MQKTFSISSNTQNSLQLQTPLQARPKRHWLAVSTRALYQSRVEDFQFLQQQWMSKAKAQGGWSCPASPSPTGLPSKPSTDPHTWGGRGQHAAPAPRVGMGCQEAIHGSPCLTAPKLSERSRCLWQDAAAWMNSGKARRQGKAGPSKTSSQNQEQGHAVLLGGFFLWSQPAALEDQRGMAAQGF